MAPCALSIEAWAVLVSIAQGRKNDNCRSMQSLTDQPHHEDNEQGTLSTEQTLAHHTQSCHTAMHHSRTMIEDLHLQAMTPRINNWAAGSVATLRDDPGIAGSIKKEEEKDD
jgi:hypothetical protein